MRTLDDFSTDEFESGSDGRTIRPQSMMFTLYGDYVIHRGGEVWVGTLIQIAAEFGLSEQAVRSSLSRMSRNGWLRVRRIGNRGYYSLTPRSKRLLEEGAQRIFVRRAGAWDGRWRMLTYSIPERRREVRDELRKQLTWMGFGPLSSGTWLSPHPLEGEVAALAERLEIRDLVEVFAASHLGFADDRALARRCWDLASLNARYEAFLEQYRPRYELHRMRLEQGEPVTDSQCFVERFLLLHEYRRFFFLDPELPAELLPPGWLGGAAAQLFQAYHALLAERANAYLDSVFEAPPSARRRAATHSVAAPAAAELLAAGYYQLSASSDQLSAVGSGTQRTTDS
jgi:phenylacetic acid degradation operon negative regulatory protein